MKKSVCVFSTLLLAFVVLPFTVFATKYDANSFINIIPKVENKANLTQEVNQTQRVDFKTNASQMKQIFNSKNSELEISSFPISTNELGTLKLKIANPIFDKKTEFVVNSEEGEKIVKAPDFTSYYGTIDGQVGSDVFISYSNNEMIGYIQNSNGEQLNLSKLSNQITNDNSIHTLALCKPFESFKNINLDVCKTNDFTVGNYNEENFSKSNKSLATTFYEVPVAIEGDNTFFNLFLSNNDTAAAITKANTYMLSVMSFASRLYERQINVSYKLVKVYLQSNRNSDPYKSLLNSKVSLDQILGYASTVWKTRSTVKRAFVSHFSYIYNQPSSSTTAGIAYVGSPGKGVLGQTGSGGGYNVLGMMASTAFPTLNYTQDIMVAAHEQGHNFSSPHTHNCYFAEPSKNLGPIDTCVTQEAFPGFSSGVGDACVADKNLLRPLNNGTIMSYCHLTGKTQLVFHPKNIALIRQAAETAAKAGTIAVPTNPIVKLTTMWGNDKFLAGNKVNIAWDVAKINTVNLKYSLDGANTWTLIKSNVNAVSDSVYVWELPKVFSTNCYVRIESSVDSSVYDQSILPFAILQPNITISEPQNNQTIGSRIATNISWENTLVSKVKVEYSTDNGITWITITDVDSNGKYIYNFKGLKKDNVLIRISNIEDNSIYDQVKVNIATESIEFSTPAENEVFCIGSVIPFKWTNKFANDLKIFYSTDNGTTWAYASKAFLKLKASDQAYSWNSSIKSNSNVILKATDYIDTTIVLAFSKSFILNDCTVNTISNDENLTNQNITLQPNPASNYINFSIENNLSESQNIEVQILDISGKIVLNLGKFDLNNGSNVFNLNIEQLPNGNYIFLSQSKNQKYSKLIKIEK